MLHMSVQPESSPRRLPAEPWGRRLLRAREDVAGMRMEEAVDLLSRYMLITTSSISRLEKIPVVPTGPRQASRRQRAYMLCLCYGVDPADFDLGPNDIPPGLRLPPRTFGPDGRVLSTIWYRTVVPVLAVAS